MKRMKIFAWAILIVAGLSACTDWLTVQPKTEVSKDDMFKSSGGFRDALIGVYTLMRENNYAPDGNLVTGMVEYIANLWYSEILRLIITGEMRWKGLTGNCFYNNIRRSRI